MILRVVARAAFSLACVVALGALLACPKPGPTPVVNPPDAADAAPVAPPAPAVSCETACAHAEKVCPGSGSPCLPACNRIGPDYARCAGAATSCSGLKGCDPLSR